MKIDPAHAAAAKLPNSFPKLHQPQLRTETLDNGVRIVTQHVPGAKTMDIRIAAQAGAFMEPKGKEGLAHLAEHLWFQGTPRRSREKIAETMGEMGGWNGFNAYTEDTETVLLGNVLNRDADKAAALLTDMYRNPSTDPHQVDKETRAVQHEIRMKLGDQGGRVYNQDAPLLLGDQPQARSTWGSQHSVDKVTPGDIKAWAKQNFTGRNTVVYMAGDRSQFPMQAVRDGLKTLPKGKQAVGPEWEGYRPGAQAMVVKHDDDSQVNVALVLPANEERLATTKGGADMLLGHIANARMKSVLREREWLTYGASADASDALSVSTELHPRDLRKGIAAMAQAVRRLPESVTQEDLDNAKVAIANQIVASKQDPASGVELGFMAALAGVEKLPSPNKTLNELRKITLSDVRASARAFSDFSNLKLRVDGGVRGDAMAQIRGGLKDAKIPVKGLEEVAADDSYWRAQLALPRDPREHRGHHHA